MPSKKNKNDPEQKEPLKPLGHYVKDRLELTKQLFSCLKSKQIKSRLPANLQENSMERIQQLCLDEILGISSKRLLSIINSTKCPLNTESDSDIEHISLSEISSDSDGLEIEPFAAKPADKQKKATEEPTKEASTTATISEKSNATTSVPPIKKPGAKEMTMLELLELQARARAIRSQLALEPVTKIELDSDDDDDVQMTEKEKEPEKEAEFSKEKAVEPPKSATVAASKSDKTKDSKKSDSRNGKDVAAEPSTSEKSKSKEIAIEKPKSSRSKENLSEKSKSNSSKEIAIEKSKSSSKESRTEKSKSDAKDTRTKKSNEPSQKSLPADPKPRRIVIINSPQKSNSTITITIPKEIEKPKGPPVAAPPIKLKRNYSSVSSETQISPNKEKVEPVKEEAKELLNASRTSSPDVITMEQNIATYFISDSDEEKEPPAKKAASPQSKIVVTSVEIIAPALVESIENEEITTAVKQIEEEKMSEEYTEDEKKTEEEVQEEKKTEEPQQSAAMEEEQEEDDGDVVDIMMSDTEMDLNENSDEEEEVENPKVIEKPKEVQKSKDIQKQKVEKRSKSVEKQKPLEKCKKDEKSKEIAKPKVAEKSKTLEKSKPVEKAKSIEKPEEIEQPKETPVIAKEVGKPQEEKPTTSIAPIEIQSSQSDDDDVVEILHSEDELLDSDKPSDSAKNSDESETWAKRYLRSSTVTSVLKTTKLAKKVRDNIAQKKRTLRTTKKKAEAKEKEFKEKLTAAEEGSMEQFEVLKETKEKE